MDMRWNLDNLYKSFKDPELAKDLAELEKETQAFKDWAVKAKSGGGAGDIAQSVAIQERLQFLSEKIYCFGSLTMSVDAKNAEARSLVERIENLQTETTLPGVVFLRLLKSHPDAGKLAASDPRLSPYAFFLEENAEKAKHLLDEKEEVAIAEMRNTGSLAWKKLWETLSSTLMIEVPLPDGKKTLPLPAVRNLAMDADPRVRRIGYEAEMAAYPRYDEGAAAALNGMKGEAILLAKKRGFDSVLDDTLLKSRLDRATLESMLSVMEESLPLFRRYFRHKAKLLGHSGGLPIYDIFAPMGESDKKYTYPEAADYVVRCLGGFDDGMAKFARHAFDNGWIDAEMRDGKRGGAFCMNLHPIGESRILANFNGSFDNVTTLAHELGHAYHGDCLKSEPILNSGYTMPVAETASIFNETIVINEALKTATEKEAFGILENNLGSYGQVIVDIYARYLFETELMKRREDGSVSVDELKKLQTDAQKKAYGDGLDHNFLHPYQWANKPHYYYADLHFYNFPYAFGLLFGKGVYAQYLKEGKSFVPKYRELLRSTGVHWVPDVAASVGIDVRDKAFWRASMKVIEGEIERFCKSG